ncbi:MAG: hypothetical protein ACR2HO_11245, partial [Rubrobacteraceae bacterium]
MGPLRKLANPENATGKDVVAHVEESQREAWVERIDLDALIPEPDMEHASLLDRQAIDDLTTDFMRWESGKRPIPNLLANRVGLIVTLLNYNGIPITLSREPALADAMGTTLHRDYRCFCLDFKDNDDEVPDKRWVHYSRDELSES